MNFRKESEDEDDVITRERYKYLREIGVIGDNDITIQWNTDGVQLFKSSNYALWCIQVIINELPYRLRRKHVLLCGVWCNLKKPDMNLFLTPFAKELVRLATIGFETKTYNSDVITKIKVITILASLDSVAKPLVSCMCQFNGEYGCPYCLHRGKRIKVGKGEARVYLGVTRAERTDEEHKKFAQEAYEQKKKCQRSEK